MRAVYHPGAHDDHGPLRGPESEFRPNVLQVLRLAYSFCSHTLGQSRIDFADPDTAFVETYVIAGERGSGIISMNGAAAKLSVVALEAPPHTIGTNTVHAMQSGLVYGYVGLVDGIVSRLQDEMEVAYARMVAVSIDEPVAQSAFRAGLGARWTFLSDAAERYVDELGLRETTDTVHRPYAPTTFVLRPDLTVHSAYNGYWFWGRPTLEDLRQDLRAVTRSLRPDWEVPR